MTATVTPDRPPAARQQYLASLADWFGLTSAQLRRLPYPLGPEMAAYLEARPCPA